MTTKGGEVMEIGRLKKDAFWLLLGLLAASIALCSGSARADDDADMFKGKILRVVVASTPGGGYDLRARVVARNLGKFLPGNPSVVTENMPGGGSVVAMNYLYNVAPRDGTVILLFQRTVLTAPLLSPKNVRFDLSKFNWIGSVGPDNGLLVSWYESPIHKTEDMFTTPMIIATASQASMPLVFNALIGTKFKIIPGYQGSAEAQLAMQRGEVMGVAEWSWSDLRNSQLYLQNKINLLMQTGHERLKDLPNVPVPMDFAKTEEDRRILDYFVSPRSLAYPVAMPPEVPPERVKILRDAFMAMGRDPQFKADIQQAGIDADLAPGEAVETLVHQMTDLPPQMADRIRTLVGGQ
jgi:tripartite-type tricarboxylate transporter receptor subunit TctC